MGTDNNDDIYARMSTLREWQANPLKVRDWEFLDPTDSTPKSSHLNLTLKSQPRPEILERCEDDGRFLFEFDHSGLIAMASHILDKLDPVTNHQVLQRIRRLLKDWD